MRPGLGPLRSADMRRIALHWMFERPDVRAAKRALKAVAPNIYSDLVTPDSPEVTSEANGMTYEWKYIDQKNKRTVQVKSISITLDAADNVIGASVP